jgi:hypothetical protein
VLRWDPTDTFLDGSLIATVLTSGGGPTRLSAIESFDASPDWHPSEDLIVFNTHDLGNTQSTTETSNLFTHPLRRFGPSSAHDDLERRGI